jgi:hypothetical protein
MQAKKNASVVSVKVRKYKQETKATLDCGQALNVA